jgi:hypothetical protein
MRVERNGHTFRRRIGFKSLIASEIASGDERSLPT